MNAIAEWENPAINSINRLSRGLSVAALFSAHAASGEDDHPVP